MDGKMGSCPDWYADIQAAKYLGIPVPDIVKIPVWWRDKALDAMNVEAEAQQIKSQHGK